MLKKDLKSANEDVVSPWRKANPRQPISNFASPGGTRSTDHNIKSPNSSHNISPPNSDHKESTKLGSSHLDLTGASPALDRSEDIQRSNSFTKVRETRSSSRNKSKSKSLIKTNSSDLFSEDDQPSGSCQFVGESFTSQSTINNTTVGSNASIRRRAGGNSINVNTTNNLSISQTNNIVNVTPPQASKSSTCLYILIGTLFVCLAMVGGLYVRENGISEMQMYSSNNFETAEHWKFVRKQVNNELGQIKTKFPNQTQATWRMIGATLKSPLQSLPDYPGVLLLLAAPPAVPAANCLASQLLQMSGRALTAPGLLPPPLYEQMIRPEDLREFDPDTAKEKLTSTLHSNLNIWRTAGISNLEQLQPAAALTLHAFADNSNAPYKQAVMIMTVTADDLAEEKECNLERRAEKILSDVWETELGRDKFSALVSRVVVSVAQIRQETGPGALC